MEVIILDIYDQLKEFIIMGKLKPGEKLREEKLSEQLEVSRTPVREALRRLESENLIVYLQNRGASVRSYTIKEIEDAYKVRSLNEGFAASIAAQNYSEDKMHLLENSLEVYYEAVERCSNRKNKDSILNLIHSNRLFHKAIVDITGNMHINNVLNEVIVLPMVYQSYYWYSDEDMYLSANQHSKIASAIMRNEAEEAKILMSAHIYHGRDLIIKNFNEIMGV